MGSKLSKRSPVPDVIGRLVLVWLTMRLRSGTFRRRLRGLCVLYMASCCYHRLRGGAFGSSYWSILFGDWLRSQRRLGGAVAAGWEPVRAAFTQNFDEGLERAAQFVVMVRGKRVVDLWGESAYGQAGAGAASASARNVYGNYGPDTVQVCMSCSKNVTATAVALLVARGQLRYEAKVSEYWPEFAQGGKGDVTLEQVMRHEGRCDVLEPRLSAADVLDPARVAARVAQMSAAPVGRRYHAVTRGFILAELIRRADAPRHRQLGAFVAEEIVARVPCASGAAAAEQEARAEAAHALKIEDERGGTHNERGGRLFFGRDGYDSGHVQLHAADADEDGHATGNPKRKNVARLSPESLLSTALHLLVCALRGEMHQDLKHNLKQVLRREQGAFGYMNVLEYDELDDHVACRHISGRRGRTFMERMIMWLLKRVDHSSWLLDTRHFDSSALADGVAIGSANAQTNARTLASIGAALIGIGKGMPGSPERRRRAAAGASPPRSSISDGGVGGSEAVCAEEDALVELGEAGRLAMAAPTRAVDSNLGVSANYMTRGGFGLFREAKPGDYGGVLPEAARGYYGWGGYGGSMMLWRPDTEVSIAYTITGTMRTSPMGLLDVRFKRLLKAVHDCLEERGHLSMIV